MPIEIEDSDPEQLRAELHELKREVRALARFPETNPGPVIQLDAEGTVLRANPAARDAFGSIELVGRSWQEIFGAPASGAWRAAMSRATASFEADVDGRCFAISLAHPADTDTVFMYGTDITERKLAEAELARRAALLEDLARFPEMNPGPVLRLDMQGTIVAANPAAIRVCGGEAIVGCAWIDVCPAVDEDFMAQAATPGAVHAREAHVSDRDLVFTYAAGEAQVFVYGADVTELKKAQSALREKERMAMLGTLSAGVAHELNNPAAATARGAQQLSGALRSLEASTLRLGRTGLTAELEAAVLELESGARSRASEPDVLEPLTRSDRESEVEDWLDELGVDEPWELAPALVSLGYSLDDLEALADRFEGDQGVAVIGWLGTAAPAYRLLEEIRSGAGRISDIVGALKAYSYLGRAPMQEVDVNDGIEKTLIILRNRLKQGVHVVLELAEDLPPIQAFGSQLNQVWTNLIDNAVSAMNGEGKLVIRTLHDAPAVVVEIEDDGPGIPDDVVPRIFDAFYTTKEPGAGTGLGLHTCREIVHDKHGGTITVKSEPGRTVFTVRLPEKPGGST